jgi:hypothetical protein
MPFIIRGFFISYDIFLLFQFWKVIFGGLGMNSVNRYYGSSPNEELNKLNFVTVLFH